jgi:hypothetical protein
MALINYYQSATVDGQWVVSYKQEEYNRLSDFVEPIFDTFKVHLKKECITANNI